MKKMFTIAVVLLMATSAFAVNWYDYLPNAFGGHTNFDPMYRIGTPEVNSVSVAQIKTLHTAPACILPAMDANYVYVVQSVYIYTHYDTNTFDANASNITLSYFDGTSTYTAATGTISGTLLLATTANDRVTTLLPTAQNGAATLYAGKGLYLYSATGDETTSNSKSVLHIVVNYAKQRI